MSGQAQRSHRYRALQCLKRKLVSALIMTSFFEPLYGY
jgi:hypothetical protein